jgi:hypothetical protein
MNEAFQIASDCQDIKQCLLGAANYIEERFARSIAINGQAQPLPPTPTNIKRPVTKPIKTSAQLAATDSARAKLASE